MKKIILATLSCLLLFGTQNSLTSNAQTPIIPKAIILPADPNGPSPKPHSDNADPALTQVVTEHEELAKAGEKAVIHTGHADIAPRILNGKWELMVRDDSGDHPIWRHLDDVVFQVHDKALLAVPQKSAYQFIKTDSQANHQAYVVPQQEISGVIWIGWSTQAPQVVNNVNGGVKMIFSGHQGEGQQVTFLQAGNFGDPQVLWNSNIKKSQEVFIDANTHTHANWIFTKPGVHLLKINVQAQINDGRTVSDTKILRFAVGDNTNLKIAAEAKWTQTNDVGSAALPANNTPSALDKSNSFPWLVALGIAIAVLLITTVAFIMHRQKNKRKQAAILAHSTKHSSPYATDDILNKE